MSVRAILTAILSVVWLSGCAENRSHPSNVEAMVDACEAIATTGDMYRYCMEVGPKNILLPEMAFRASAIGGEASFSIPASHIKRPYDNVIEFPGH